MLFATAGQGAMWLWMMACGAVMGAWYLVPALLRRLMQAGFWLTLALDLVFGAGCGAIFILFLVSGNYGRVRLYEIVAVLAGALVFALAVSPLLEAAEACLRRTLGKIWTWLSGKGPIKVIFK